MGHSFKVGDKITTRPRQVGDAITAGRAYTVEQVERPTYEGGLPVMIRDNNGGAYWPNFPRLVGPVLKDPLEFLKAAQSTNGGYVSIETMLAECFGVRPVSTTTWSFEPLPADYSPAF